MNLDNGANGQRDDGEKATPSTETGVGPKETNAVKKRGEAEANKGLSPFEKFTIALGVIGILIGIANTTGIFLQGQIMQRSSSDSTKQMNQLLEYSRRQSTAADKISIAANDFKVSSAGVEAHSKDAAKAMQGSASSMKSLAAATKTFSDQAKRSADIADKSLDVSDRAWVGIKSFDLDGAPESGKTTMGGRATLENKGKSPARHVQAFSMFITLCGQLVQHPHPAFDNGYMASTFPLFPDTQSQTTDSPKGTWTDTDIATLKNPDCKYYVFTKITYDDIFGQHHWTHMCGFWNSDNPPTLRVCPAYNETDDDYPDGKEP
jgi:hypothetical protein